MKVYKAQVFGQLMVTSAYIRGPQSDGHLKLLVDTGSVYTILKRSILAAVGYSPTVAKEFRFIVTGSKVERLPRLRLQRFNSFCRRSPLLIRNEMENQEGITKYELRSTKYEFVIRNS